MTSNPTLLKATPKLKISSFKGIVETIEEDKTPCSSGPQNIQSVPYFSSFFHSLPAHKKMSQIASSISSNFPTMKMSQQDKKEMIDAKEYF